MRKGTDMDMTINTIMGAILGNEKRVAKIKAKPKHETVMNLVTGECATRRINMSHDDKVKCVAMILNKLN